MKIFQGDKGQVPVIKKKASKEDGYFKFHIPIEKQKLCPRVRISKSGYQTEEYTRQGVGLNWQVMLLK